MKTLLFAVVAWFALAGSLSAQAAYCEVDCRARFNQPVTVFTEQTDGATQYRITVNGAFVGQTYALANGNVEFLFGKGFSVGVYTFVIEAIGPDWISPSEPGTLTVQRNRVKFR